jgi:hypothetical protein
MMHPNRKRNQAHPTPPNPRLGKAHRAKTRAANDQNADMRPKPTAKAADSAQTAAAEGNPQPRQRTFQNIRSQSQLQKG